MGISDLPLGVCLIGILLSHIMLLRSVYCSLALKFLQLNFKRPFHECMHYILTISLWQYLTAAFWILVVVVLAVVDAVTESQERYTLGAFAATSPVLSALIVCRGTRSTNNIMLSNEWKCVIYLTRIFVAMTYMICIRFGIVQAF